MIHAVADDINLTRCTESRLKQQFPILIKSAILIVTPGMGCEKGRMANIQDFSSKMLAIAEIKPDEKVVVCPERNTSSAFVEAASTLGAYLILHKSMAVEMVENSIAHSIVDDLDGRDTCSKTWRALDRALKLGWLVDPASDVEPVLDVEELAHYATRANGTLHLTVPGDLFFFPTPSNLTDGQLWADHTTASGSTVRHFSAAYYAGLFGDFNVSVVVCLGTGSESTAAAFLAEGIEVVDLELAADGSSLLRGLDRLLSLARAAPGAVAVHSGNGFDWPEYIGTLTEAYLISRHGFDEGSAEAWLRMVSPWMARGGGAAGCDGVVPLHGVCQTKEDSE